MELRHLRYFAALAEELSFTRAAEKVHVTQSTLSHQIKQLEGEIGQRLFDRARKRVVMTEAGENLLPNVTKVLREIDSSVQAMKGAGDPLTGVLQIGTTHTFNTNLLPECLAAFLNKHASLSVVVSELCAAGVEAGLQAGLIDIGIGYLPASNQGLAFEPLYIEEMVLVVSDQHPLATRRRIRLAELHRQPLILATQESATRGMLDERFESAGAQPFVAAEIDAIGPALDLARRTRIGAIVSEHAVSGAPGLHVIALEDPTPLRTPGLLLKASASHSSACRSFAALVRHTIAHAGMRTPRGARSRRVSL
jgi:LysR family transcriptional regulator, cyn operon transcriptional activator